MTSDSGDVVICRACLQECCEYKSLYKQGLILGEVTTLGTLMSFCMNLDCLQEEDHLPGQICARCVQKLAKSYYFKKTVLEANETLRLQHGEFAISSFNSADVVEEPDEEVEEHHIEHYDVVGTEDLQGLANAAQLKRSLDNMEYMTVTGMHDDVQEAAEHEELEEVEEKLEFCEDNEEEEQTEIIEINKSEDITELEECEELNLEVEAEEEQTEAHVYEVLMVDDGEKISEAVRLDQNVRKRRRTGEEEVVLSSDGELLIEPPKRTRNKIGSKPCNPELQCPECGKQLSNPNSFKYHMQLHSDATPYLCSLCGEGFKTRNAYDGHIVLHDPNNPNTCQECGKSYRQMSSLRAHILSQHSGERPFQCDICGKGLTQRSGYKKHMLTHTGEKPFSCDICGREFRTSSNLLAHRRCHSTEKPFTCEHCDKSFHSMEQRKRHMIVHTGARLYACDTCGKAYKRRSSLLVHRQTHDANVVPTSLMRARTSASPKLVDAKVSRSNVVELY